jgi:DeoR/GlpR family transcriptional regulator of sugar metabolism
MLESTEKRKRAILDELTHARMVQVSDLSRKLGVSEVSIRHALADLEARGLLRRVRGGAVSVPWTTLEWSFNEKMSMRREQKERIGRAAAAMVSKGDVLIMDSGTTVVHVARNLSRDLLSFGNLIVITSSIPIIRELGPWKGVHLIVLGGVYLPEQEVLVGPQAISSLADLHAGKMFLGADGISLEGGVTTDTVLDAEVDRTSVKASEQVIAVIDSSKIGHRGLVTVVPLHEIDILVTDDGAPADFVSQVRELGVEVKIV